MHWVTRVVLSSLNIRNDAEFVNKHTSLETLKKSLYNVSAVEFHKIF